MHCPFCDYQDSRVVDSRSVNEGIRRRRQCLHCDRRFTTYERIQADSFLVIKKDGRREQFSREKLISGVREACTKRPIAYDSIERLVDDVERQLHQMGKVEILSSTIGELVMELMRKLDRVAYIRFASVYRDFADIETFKKEVDALVQLEKGKPSSAQLPLIPEEEARLSSRRRKSSRGDKQK